ncbi:uncharacterized protein PGRI_019990 [Penicillium griseofulvum]|uniref:Uncharacterized protein n=1 Tax=Penicillium patulum TaxID=5078 RepID=A0A135LGP4_PENPA|nr:uncharacterized protein PGRI_019990 [Penicillium griseofulvum]KXG48129.1 hypothetical protein PGRI_019990 [Penicillium griseofulvum]
MVNTTPEHILDIEDALVCNALASDENREHGENTLDFQRCVRLHYYLVAYAYMGTNTPDLEALASKSWFFNQYENIDAIRSRLDPPTRTELGGHGVFHPFGGEQRAQILERPFDRWTESIESEMWTVGENGVEGGIDFFQDADHAWEDYWIPPSW